MNPLPRFDLREPAFRRYERYIALACKGNLIVDPKAELGVSSLTFCARFSDAILAKRRYKYSSAIIPDAFDLTLLRAVELDDGRVLLRNTSIVLSEPTILTKPPISESEILSTMEKVARHQIQGIYELDYHTQDELQFILSTAASHPEIDCQVVEHNGKVNFYTI